MADSIPDAAMLLQAAVAYLEAELLPTLAGYHRFQTRVTVNVLRTVQRELRLGATQRAQEAARLAALLGHGGTVADMNIELADAIRSGAMPIDAPGLADHLRQGLREALAINNPKWIA